MKLQERFKVLVLIHVNLSNFPATNQNCYSQLKKGL